MNKPRYSQTNSSKSRVEGCTRGQGQSALQLSKKPAGKYKQRLPTGPCERQYSGGSVSLRKGAHSICHAGNLSPQTWLGPTTLLQFNTEAKMQKEVRDNVRPRNIDSLIKCLMAAYCKTEELVVGQMWASLFHPTPSAQPNLSKPHLFTGLCVLTGSGVDFLSERSAFLLVSAQHSAVSAPITLWILL